MVFASGPEDMPGVDRSITSHRLAVDPGHKREAVPLDEHKGIRKE